ncbi:hypothetical protein GIB67_001168 [Kingdonia uniflora]|uniref:ACT domain-containing protein n=1 Tax=Kingdonia uniflora TaxID=39325 RepID=A0A7J7LG42_9MAGN|nr:hypothetical protein GIB67_001168 [Kingdonia uniflora]
MIFFRRASSKFPQLSEFITRRSFNSSKYPQQTFLPSTTNSTHGVHLFQCPDVVGIVSKLSECIALRGGNILSVDVFVPENKNVFYSRR